MKDIKFCVNDKEEEVMFYPEDIDYIDFLGGLVSIDGQGYKYLASFEDDDIELLQYTEQNDHDGNEIYDGFSVRQYTVVPCPQAEEIDFTGTVKMVDGTWCIDDGEDALPLFNENCELEIVEVKK